MTKTFIRLLRQLRSFLNMKSPRDETRREMCLTEYIKWSWKLLYKYIIINEAVRRYPYIQNKLIFKNSTISSLKHITKTQNNLPCGSIRLLNTSPCPGGKPHGREIQKDVFMSFNIREEPTLMSRSQNSSSW